MLFRVVTKSVQLDVDMKSKHILPTHMHALDWIDCMNKNEIVLLMQLLFKFVTVVEFIKSIQHRIRSSDVLSRIVCIFVQTNTLKNVPQNQNQNKTNFVFILNTDLTHNETHFVVNSILTLHT